MLPRTLNLLSFDNETGLLPCCYMSSCTSTLCVSSTPWLQLSLMCTLDLLSFHDEAGLLPCAHRSMLTHR